MSCQRDKSVTLACRTTLASSGWDLSTGNTIYLFFKGPDVGKRKHRDLNFLKCFYYKLKAWFLNKPLSKKRILECPGSIRGAGFTLHPDFIVWKFLTNMAIWFSHPQEALLTVSSALLKGCHQLCTWIDCSSAWDLGLQHTQLAYLQKGSSPGANIVF